MRSRHRIVCGLLGLMLAGCTPAMNLAEGVVLAPFEILDMMAEGAAHCGAACQSHLQATHEANLGYETRYDRQPIPPAMGQQRDQREGGGGDLEAQLRQTEATCGRPYRGPTDQREHSRFHCMYAYFLQCNNLVDQHRTVCAQYEAMRANGAPHCPHC